MASAATSPALVDHDVVEALGDGPVALVERRQVEPERAGLEQAGGDPLHAPRRAASG